MTCIKIPLNLEQRILDVVGDRATAEAVLALIQLVRMRNAYNGDWVPDWDVPEENKYVIEFQGEELIIGDYWRHPTSPLFFKTKELCSMFLVNFHDLIEKLKPLYGIKEGGEE